MLRRTSWLLFLAVWLGGLLTQFSLWSNWQMLDRAAWLDETTHFAHGEWRTAATRVMYGYPATSILMLATGLIWLHLPVEISFNLSLAILNSFIIAGIALTCYQLRPTTLWWLASTGLFYFSSHYLRGTPPSNVIFPLLTLICLLLLYKEENSVTDYHFDLLLGFCIGLGLATRLDITLALVSLWLIPEFWRARKISWSLLIYIIGSFFIFDPYLWLMPIQHVADIYTKIRFHYNDGIAYVTSSNFLSQAGLAVASVIITSLAVYFKKTSLSRTFIISLLVSTGLVSLILLESHYHPIWYFLPMIAIWEIFGWLIVLENLKHYYPRPKFLAEGLPLLLIAGYVSYQLLTIGGTYFIHWITVTQ